MRKALFSSLFFGLCATAPFALRAYDTDEYNGEWKVIIQPGAGKPRIAKLLLTGYAGTWYNSSVSPKCPDITVEVRPVNSNLLEGTLSTGESVKLLRQ